MVPAPTFAFSAIIGIVVPSYPRSAKVVLPHRKCPLVYFSHFFTSISGMKIHSVFNYKLHRLIVMCDKYHCVFNPLFCEKFISAIIKIYQRNSDYISDFQDISAHL